MRKEIPSIVENAIATINGFNNVYKTLQQNTAIQGKSNSTFKNYIRRIAIISLHFNKLPEQLSDDEIQEYLASLAMSKNSPSRSSFKHMVYGLRYYFRHIGKNKRAVNLPSLKKDVKLPTIFNKSELKKLFVAPSLLKHRIILTLSYSAGLRSKELINLKISDIDFERKTIHIRKSKYNKDRIVPLSDYIAKGIKKYIKVENPDNWLFNGKEPDGRYSPTGLAWVMREALKKTDIKKNTNLHSLRHSYATHLLEEGVNIVKIKDLLGHSHISTTMIYLHIAQLPDSPVHSPLDTLYGTK